MITASFGALNGLEEQPGIRTVFGFAVGAAATFTLLQGVASSGFRRSVEGSPREVVTLGTALNFVSAGVAVGVAVLMGLIFPGVLAWTLGGFMAAAAYVMLEAAELAIAGRVMRSRRRREDGADADPG